MAYAINLRSDNESCAPIRALWTKCGALEDVGSMEALAYPPHITFAIYESIDVQVLSDAMAATFDGRDSATIQFEGIDYFESPQAIVLWAKPILPAWLWSAHDKIHAHIDSALCRPHYRPKQWVPHCSLALSINPERKARAIDLVGRFADPVDVRFDVGDCVSFMPVKILKEIHLRVAQQPHAAIGSR